MPIETSYSKYLADVSLTGARAVIADKATSLGPLRAISEAVASQTAPQSKWTRKEILGHLVDSASNNTQRFVRAQIRAHLDDGVLRLAGYAQDDWVRVSAYQSRAWAEIVDLWSVMNRNIVHIVDNFDRTALATPCAIGDSSPMPVEHVIIDYAGHLVHHYKQIVA